MADRSAARAYGHAFTVLAMNPCSICKAIALELSRQIRNKGYDFSIYQMDCDQSLVMLDLAKKNTEGTRAYTEYGNYQYFF